MRVHFVRTHTSTGIQSQDFPCAASNATRQYVRRCNLSLPVDQVGLVTTAVCVVPSLFYKRCSIYEQKGKNVDSMVLEGVSTEPRSYQQWQQEGELERLVI